MRALKLSPWAEAKRICVGLAIGSRYDGFLILHHKSAEFEGWTMRAGKGSDPSFAIAVVTAPSGESASHTTSSNLTEWMVGVIKKQREESE